jgi:hypothetical protein
MTLKYNISNVPLLLHAVLKLITINLYNKKFCEELIAYFPWYDAGHVVNDASNNSAIVASAFVTAGTFLPSRSLATIGGFLPSRCLETIGGIHRHTHTATWSYKPTFIFQNEWSRLITATSSQSPCFGREERIRTSLERCCEAPTSNERLPLTVADLRKRNDASKIAASVKLSPVGSPASRMPRVSWDGPAASIPVLQRPCSLCQLPN